MNEMQDAGTSAAFIIEKLFNVEGVNPGIAELSLDYTTTKDGKRDRYHVIVYQESSGWHEGIQAAMKDDDE